MMDLLKQGITPPQLALAISLGAGIGIFPLIGTTTILATVICFAFRLNITAIQIANYAVYPIQIALIIPYIEIGKKFIPVENIYSLQELVYFFQHDLSMVFQQFGNIILAALIGWTILVVPIAYGFYYISLLFIKKLQKKEA